MLFTQQIPTRLRDGYGEGPQKRGSWAAVPTHAIRSCVRLRTSERPGCAERRPSPYLLGVGNKRAKTLGHQRPTLWRQTHNNCQQEETVKLPEWGQGRRPWILLSYVWKEPCARCGLGWGAGGGDCGHRRAGRMDPHGERREEGRQEQTCWEERV